MNETLRLVLLAVAIYWWECDDESERQIIQETLFEICNTFFAECNKGVELINKKDGAIIKITYDNDHGWKLEGHS